MKQYPAQASLELNVEPIVDNYAEAPIFEAFDWKHIVQSARASRELDVSSPWYLVVFRSQLREEVDTTQLHEHDAMAHVAALESPELVHYYADHPNAERKAVSFCLWTDMQVARRVASDPRHARATGMVALYESYSLERYDVIVGDDAEVSLIEHQ